MVSPSVLLRRLALVAFLALPSLAEEPPETNVIIELAAPPTKADLARLSKRAAIRQTYRHVFTGVSARVSRKSLAEIAALPNVKAIHPDRIVYAQLEQSVPLIGAPQVWQQYGARGQGVVIAIIDSGIDYHHAAFGDGFGPGHKVAGGYDLANDDPDPFDDYGHGTHVAGIAAGNGGGVVGVAPEATLLAYKVLNNDGSAFDSIILAGIERAIDPNGDGDTSDHADVVNISLGRRRVGDDDDPLVTAVERGIAAGAVFCISAGNEGDNFTIKTPGIAPSAITVGATDFDAVASFSSRGPVPGTWTMKPEVAAPGQAITSAKAGADVIPNSGTSMSAPHAAGVAALILELHPDWTPADVKAAMVSTATPIFTGTQTQPRTMATGGGRIHALRSVETTILPSPATISFGVAAPQTTRTLRLTNHGASSQTLTMTAPGVPSGATLTANPASVTIAPGATFEVALTLATADLPAPSDDGLAATGHLQIASETTSLHVPWMVMSGNQIAVSYLGTEPYDLYILAQNSVVKSIGDKARTVTSVVPPGTVDVVVLTKPEAGIRPRAIVCEEQPVDGFTYITISPDEASLELEVAGVDEQGLPLAALGGVRQIVQELVLPSGRIVEWSPAQSPLFSTLKKTVVRTYEMAVPPAGDAYFAMHRVLVGLEHSETLTFDPSDWTSQPLSIRCAKACDFSSAIGFGTTTFAYSLDLSAGLEATRTFHVTPSRDPGVNFRAYLKSKRQGIADGPRRKPWSLLSPAMRVEEGRMKFTVSEAPGLLDYTPPRQGETITFGSGPGHLRTTMGDVQGSVQGSWRVQVVPSGALGEDIAEAAEQLSQVSLVDSAEKPVQFRLVQNPGVLVTGAPLPPDTYRFRMTQGHGTLTATFDTRKHPAAPTFTSLRIENSTGTSVATVRAGDTARVLFSARRSTLDLPSDSVVPSATKASWRPSGTTDWQPLPVSVLEPFGLPAGTIFASDLGAATAAIGSVDLKLEITDEDGGTAEWVVAPAFTVEAGKRRRAVR